MKNYRKAVFLVDMTTYSNSAILIIARLSSTRVPGKNLIPLNDIPMISRLYARLSKSKLADRVIVCTSDEQSDAPLVDHCRANGLLVGRGPLNDVMARIIEVALEFGVETIVEVLGDNPFVSGCLVDHAMAFYRQSSFEYVANFSNDYTHNIDLQKFPIGVRVQVYDRQSAQAYRAIGLESASHPSSFLYSNPHKFRVGFFGAEGPFAAYSGNERLNLSINYPKNVELAGKIFELFGNDVDVVDILQWINGDSDLLALAEQRM